jgi:hypothetical protein
MCVAWAKWHNCNCTCQSITNTCNNREMDIHLASLSGHIHLIPFSVLCSPALGLNTPKRPGLEDQNGIAPRQSAKMACTGQPVAPIQTGRDGGASGEVPTAARNFANSKHSSPHRQGDIITQQREGLALINCGATFGAGQSRTNTIQTLDLTADPMSWTVLSPPEPLPRLRPPNTSVMLWKRRSFT